MKRLEVVAALIRKKDKILLCQRKENDVFGLLWEFPGGKVEKNETLKDAIKREIKEELGLIIKANNLIDKFVDGEKNFKINVSLFDCKIVRGKPQAKECADFGFFSFSQIKRLNLAPVDRKIFNYLIKNNLVLK